MLLDSDQPTNSLPHRDTTRRDGRLVLWLMLWLVPLVVFFAAVTLFATHSTAIYHILNLWAVARPVDYPFLDLRYIFAGADCWSKGVNVYLSNPCDPLGRAHAYSPLWLRFGFLRDWTPTAGLIVDGVFILALMALPAPRKACELAVLLLAILSPPVVFVLQRANVDIIIFLMLLGAAALWTHVLRYRMVGYAIILAAGLLKFYPLIVLTTAVRERTRTCAAVCIAAGGVLLGFAVYFHAELRAMAVNIPTGSYLVGDMFGAINLPDGLALVFGLPEPGWVRILAAAMLAALCMTGILTLSHWIPLRRAVAELAPFDAALLLFGAALFVGCFFAGQSVGYRGVHLLLVIPGLLALWRQATDRRVRRFARATTFLVLFLMWQGVLTWNNSFLDALQSWIGSPAGSSLWAGLWLIRELGWWALAAALGGIFMGFVREAQAMSWLFAGRRLRSDADRL
ncbi:MAG TPA: hypothetical protein VMV19_12770 [Xanthobacteraceae bacterium]|nr:hypothetical protein [Xanthobacteraceae bacterium]